MKKLLRHRNSMLTGLLLIVAAVFLLVVSTFASGLNYQTYIVLLFVMMAGIAWRPNVCLVTATLLVYVVGFVRRILAEDGRIASDPLVVLPVLLVIIAIAYSDKKYNGPRDIWQRLVWVAVAVLVVANFAHFLVAPPLLFTLIVQCSLLLVITLLRGGRLPDVWATLERVLPALGTAVAIYGIAQFFWLFEWDRLWMIASELNSIGQPFPLELRVFGTAESPASFAAVLSASLLVSICRFRVVTDVATRAALVVGMATMALALVLTGVRSALLGLAVALAMMAISGKGGASRIVPVGIAAVGGYLVVEVVGRFGADSTVLSADRLTNFDAGTDGSAQVRLQLLALIPRAMLYPLGIGPVVQNGGVANLDNMFVDLLYKAGPFVALFVLALFVKVLFDAVYLRLDSDSAGAVAVTIFYVVFSISLNPFATANGIIGAVAMGTVMRRAWLRKTADTPSPKKRALL